MGKQGGAFSDISRKDWKMERARIIVKGEVQKVGFRSSIVEQMKSVKLKGYAENLPDGMVEVVCEGEKEKIEELINRIKETPPHFARVDSAEPEWQEYVGDLKEPDRREEDVPVEGTQEKMLKVMQSFDQKAEIVVVTLGNMDKRLESIDGKQDQMLDKQDQMLDKQDSTIDKIDDMHHDLAGRFDNLRGDYGVIHKTILEMLDEMRKERKESNERTEKLVKAILQSKKG